MDSVPRLEKFMNLQKDRLDADSLSLSLRCEIEEVVRLSGNSIGLLEIASTLYQLRDAGNQGCLKASKKFVELGRAFQQILSLLHEGPHARSPIRPVTRKNYPFLPPLALVGIGVVTVLAIRRGRRSFKKADPSAITAPLPLEGGADVVSTSDSS